MAHKTKLFWAIAGVAFTARLVAAIFTGGLWHPELNEYDAIARNMLAGRGFTYSHIGVVYHSYAPPLLPWLTAGSYWLTGSIVPVMLIQMAAGAALAVVAAAIAMRLRDGWIAPAAAGLFVAFHPGLVVYASMKSHPLSFDALFFTLSLLATLRLRERPTLGRAAEVGAIVGLGTLSRSTMLIFLPIGAVWLFAMAARSARLEVVRNVLIGGACVTAILAPWSIRDALVLHQNIFLISTTGEDFWDGNNPYATGHSYVDANHIVLLALPPADLADLKSQPDELAQSQWFMSHAKTFIREHPEAFLRLTILKWYHFWWFAPQTGVLYPQSWLVAYKAYYTAMLLLAAIGTWSVLRANASGGRGRLMLVALFLLGLSATQSLYYVEARHRWAIEPMLLAISGVGAAALIERRRPRGVTS